MQPKSLLRLPAATSTLEDLATGSFRPALDDPATANRRDQVQRLVFCTGKIYYDLLAFGEHPANIALVRVEELAPWPREIGALVDTYPNLEEVAWAQEEPKNMGAWRAMRHRIEQSVPREVGLVYEGRPSHASPSEGYPAAHAEEQTRIVRAALGLSGAEPSA
jgi:2-oxoglutarate dehydrogenase E1 component